MKELLKNKDEDINNLRLLRRRLAEADRSKILGFITIKEYELEISKIMAQIELLEVKYGL